MFGWKNHVGWLLFCPAIIAIFLGFGLEITQNRWSLLVYGGWAVAIVVLLLLLRRRPRGRQP